MLPMTCTDLAIPISLGLLVALVYGICWCFNRFLCSRSPREQAWQDCAEQLRRANRDFEVRERLKQSSASSF